VIAAAIDDLERRPRLLTSDPWLIPWRIGGAEVRFRYIMGSERMLATITKAPNAWHVRVNNNAHEATPVARREHALTLLIDGQQQRLHIVQDGEATLIGVAGRSYRIEREPALSIDALGGAGSASSGHSNLESPMPGTVIKVLVAAGDTVTANQPVVVMEAMKMEHTIVAPRNGIVSAVAVNEGQIVGGGATLVELDAAE
jgi:biotin carboxyl carrier protein